MWMVKNFNNWMNKKLINNKRAIQSIDAKLLSFKNNLEKYLLIILDPIITVLDLFILKRIYIYKY
jgi:hypothetical protein